MNDRDHDNKEKEKAAAARFKQWQAAVWALLSTTRVLFWWGPKYLEYFNTQRAQKTPAEFLVEMRAFRARPWYVKLADWLGSPFATLRRNRVYTAFTSLYVGNKFLLAGKDKETDDFTYHADSFSQDEIMDWEIQASLQPTEVPDFFAPQISELANIRAGLKQLNAPVIAAPKPPTSFAQSTSDLESQTDDTAEISFNASTSTSMSSTATVARTFTENKSDAEQKASSNTAANQTLSFDSKDMPEFYSDAPFKGQFHFFVKITLLLNLDWKTSSFRLVERVLKARLKEFEEYRKLAGFRRLGEVNNASSSSMDTKDDEKATAVDLEAQCHAAQRCLYPLVKELEWIQDISYFATHLMVIQQLYCPLNKELILLTKKKSARLEEKELYDLATQSSQAPVLIQQDGNYYFFGRQDNGKWLLTSLEDKEETIMDLLKTKLSFPAENNKSTRTLSCHVPPEIIKILAPHHHRTYYQDELLQQAWLDQALEEFWGTQQREIEAQARTIQATLSAAQYTLQHTQALAISETLRRNKTNQAAKSANVADIPDMVFDHYHVSILRLGIDPALQCVTPELVKDALREKRLQWHPDRYDPPGRRAKDEPSLLASFQELIDRRTSDPTLCSPAELEGNQFF